MMMFNAFPHRPIPRRASWSGVLQFAAGALLAMSVWMSASVQAQESAAPAGVVQAPVAELTPRPVEPQVIDNPYGLGALWAQGDFVAKGTLVILVLMSMGSWYILVTKLYASFQIAAEARVARSQFFKAPNLQAGTQLLKESSAFRYIAQTGIDAGVHHEGTLTEHIDRNTWVTMSVQRSVDEVQSRLQDGLAVLGYNWLVRRNKITMDAVRGFSADLHGILMGAKGIR